MDHVRDCQKGWGWLEALFARTPRAAHGIWCGGRRWSTVAVGYHYSDQRTAHCENERSRALATYTVLILSQWRGVERATRAASVTRGPRGDADRTSPRCGRTNIQTRNSNTRNRLSNNPPRSMLILSQWTAHTCHPARPRPPGPCVVCMAVVRALLMSESRSSGESFHADPFARTCDLVT